MRVLLAAALLALGGTATALDLRPKLEAEGRWFFSADEQPLLGSVAGTLELFQPVANEGRIIGELFGRYDPQDPQRTHVDARELYYEVLERDFEFRIGSRRVFWGVTESRHLVDVINQSDLVEDFDGEAKLGQPMLNLSLILDTGTLEVFAMPYQRQRTFPGEQGYPRLPLPVHSHESLYESSLGRGNLDHALRYRATQGELDYAVAFFRGTARDPRLLPCLRRGASGQYVQGSPDGPTCDIFEGIVLPSSPTPEALVPVLQQAGLAPADDEVAMQVAQEVRDNLVLVPFYDRLSQVSLELQWVTGALALKLEGLRRVREDGATVAAVSGFEYTWGDAWATGYDLGLLMEYLYDQRDDSLDTLFDDEVFIGGRAFLNDVANTQLLAGVIANRENFGNRLYGVEFSRSLSGTWRLAAKARIFSAIPDDSPAQFLSDQDYLTVTLEHFF